jgi:hypothetical protein
MLMNMKGLSVLLTIVLFLLAQGLARQLKRAGARPADHGPGNAASFPSASETTRASVNHPPQPIYL